MRKVPENCEDNHQVNNMIGRHDKTFIPVSMNSQVNIMFHVAMIKSVIFLKTGVKSIRN